MEYDVSVFDGLKAKVFARGEKLDELDEKISAIEKELAGYNAQLEEAKARQDVVLVMELEGNPPAQAKALAALKEMRQKLARTYPATTADVDAAWAKVKPQIDRQIVEAREKAAAARAAWLNADAEVQVMYDDAQEIAKRFEQYDGSERRGRSVEHWHYWPPFQRNGRCVDEHTLRDCYIERLKKREG